jgi:hypothetical protein
MPAMPGLPAPRPRPGGTLKKPPPPPAPASEPRALWRFEIWTNPTGPKGGSKLVYSQIPAYFTVDEIASVVAAHKAVGTHARIWRQRMPGEPSAGTWQQVNDPPGSVYDLEPLSGLGVTIAPPATGGQMLLPPCVPQEVKLWAESQCQVQAPHGYDTLGQLMMPLSVQLNPQTFDWTKAPVCSVAALPVCAPPAGGGQPSDDGQDGGGEKSESTGLIIGGIVLLAVIGGGYVYYKTRKK